MQSPYSWLPRLLVVVWGVNCILASIIAIRQVWIPFMDAENSSYTTLTSEPFDGTTMPIAYVPDWSKTQNQDKTKRFEDISISEYLPIPLYDAIDLANTNNPTKNSLILHYTYFTTYMGDYQLDYKEYAGSHLGVDIRAPIGTPILSIANGIVVRTVEADNSGNRFIVIKHDGIPNENGGTKTLYSGYLHLSEISVREGMRVKKGDMIGRVGISGIATTPHLHLQIDTSDAPFHPYWHFTSSEARDAGLDFFSAVNAGLGKDKAMKYTIHPMIFINTYLGGVSGNTTVGNNAIELPTSLSSAPKESPQTIVASYKGDPCEKSRYSDVSEKSAIGRSLYPLMDKKCMFREGEKSFSQGASVNYREALINIMKYYDIKPVNGTSHFLDITIGDSLQGYALVAYRKGILDGNYAYPDRILTREEFISLLVKIASPAKNPSQIKIYSDVDPLNPNFQNIQDYGFMMRARGGKIYPKTLMTRNMMLQIFANLQKK